MPFSTRWVIIGCAALLSFVLIGCDTGGSASEGTADCDSRTGNAMSATVNGEALCTDLGSAVLSTAGDVSRLSVVGFFGSIASGRSITLNIDNPTVGSVDLSEANAEHEAMYSTDAEDGYVADRDEGSGSIELTELTNARVKGTFAFTGVGYDADSTPTGTEARVTKGTFDFAIGGRFDF